MFKACLVIDRYHKVRKSLSLWHLKKELRCILATPWWTGQAKGKVWKNFESAQGQCCELWAISHPVAWSKCSISEVLPGLYIFFCILFLFIYLFIYLFIHFSSLVVSPLVSQYILHQWKIVLHAWSDA